MRVFLLALLTLACLPLAAADRHENGHRRHGHSHHGHGHRHGGGSVVVGGRWVPGHYETRIETVVVSPARVEKVWVEPVLESRVRNGKEVLVEVSPGYFKYVECPARVETREVRTWVPGYYVDGPRFWFRF